LRRSAAVEELAHNLASLETVVGRLQGEVLRCVKEEGDIKSTQSAIGEPATH
jgi:hypothetical protein